jgi:hypothetical protein
MSIWMMGENRKSDLMTDDAMPFFFKGFSVLLQAFCARFADFCHRFLQAGFLGVIHVSPDFKSARHNEFESIIPQRSS